METRTETIRTIPAMEAGDDEWLADIVRIEIIDISDGVGLGVIASLLKQRVELQDVDIGVCT